MEEENKEISKETNTEVKQHKKKKKKRHKKTNKTTVESEGKQTEEPKIKSEEIKEVKDEPKNETIKVYENKDKTKIKIIELYENVEETRIDNKDNKEKSEPVAHEPVSPSNNIEENKPQEEKPDKINEELKEEIKEEILIKETSKKSKGKRKKGKKKNNKEEKMEGKNIEIKTEEDSKKINNSNNLIEEPKILKENEKEFIKSNETAEKNIYPEKDIKPLNLFTVDEDDGEIDYLKAEQAYELSVLLESHKFIRNAKNIDKLFINLIKRQVIRYERNLYNLSLNDNKFFILYELQASKNSNLSLMDIMILDTIKSILISYPDVHLIIFIEFNDSFEDNSSREKLSNIIIYLNFNSDIDKRIHAFSPKLFKEKNEMFQKHEEEFKKFLSEEKVVDLFNLTEKNEEKDKILEYLFCLAISPNPLIYSRYIPEITSDFKCLIINSIFYMNRYQLCFSASKALSFPEPSIISLKVIPHIKEINWEEIIYDLDGDMNILSSDDEKTLYNKIGFLTNKSRGRNINRDILYQYLSYLEEDDEKLKEIIKQYEEGKENNQDIIKNLIFLIEEKFKNMKNKDIKRFDINKYCIEIS